MFDEIKKKFPKAWQMFYDWLLYDAGIDSTMILCDPETVSGWQYKFFDEQGIIIEIEYHIFGEVFGYYIIGTWRKLWTKENFNTRQEAEQAAFTKAFGILEDK